MATPNFGFNTLPQNSYNLAPPYNDAMQVVDAVVQLGIEGVATAPPVTVDEDAGKTWRIVSPATGPWAGKEGQVALCTAATLWRYFLPGSQVKFLLDKSDGGFYKYSSGSWGLAAGLSDAPSDGSTYGRKDGAWAAVAAPDAADVAYDNTASGLAALDVQAALDEILGMVEDNAKSPVTALSIASGVVNVDLALGKDFTLLLTANVTSITFSNLPGAGFAAEADITITQDATGGRTVAFPASFKALGGSDTAVATAANAVTEWSGKTKDNGTTWRYAMQESA